MKKYLIAFSILVAAFTSTQAKAACSTTPVPAGSTQTQINAAITACANAGGGVVNLAAGNYTISGQVNVLCHVSVQGPTPTWAFFPHTHYQTAILTASGISQPFHTTAGCNEVQPYPGIRYLEWNGNQINNGGGFVNIVGGTNGFQVDHNYIHGATTTSFYDGGTSMAGVLLSGGGGSGAQANPTQNIDVSWNELGPELNGQDCGNAMRAADTEASQGLCVGFLNDTYSKNVNVHNNIVQNMENGTKVVEATTNQDQTENSGNTQNFAMSTNWFFGMHRINYETQSNIYKPAFPTSQTVNYNMSTERDFTANSDPSNQGGKGQQNYDLSIANGCGNPAPTDNCPTNMDFNGDIQVLATSRSAGNEVWGTTGTHGNFNYMEGRVAVAGGGFDWSDQGDFVFNNNIFNITSGNSTNCVTATGGYFNNENGSNNHVARTPTSCTGNSYSNIGTGTTASAAPTISPSSGTFTGAHTVTVTNTGTNFMLNVTDWCTTDGTNPVIGAANTKPLHNGGTISVSTGTLKCVGMWGDLNQPYSYPAGVGLVPSALVTGTYTQGSQGTLNSITVTSSGSTNLAPTNTIQLVATGNYINPTSTQNISSTSTWSSSNIAVGTVSATGLYTAGSTAGTTNITAVSGTVTSSPALVMTTTVANPTITSGNLGAPNNQNTAQVGGTIQFTAFGNYSDGQQRTLPDSFGNTITSWTTVLGTGSGTNIVNCGTMSSTGLFTATTIGACNVKAICSCGVTFSQWTVTVSAATKTLVSIALTAVNGATSVSTGSTLQLIATGTYSDQSTSVITTTISSWATSDGTLATIGPGGLITGVSAGSPTFTGTLSGVTSPALPIAVTSSIVLQNIAIANSISTSTMLVGWTLPWTATCIYSNGDHLPCNSADAHGNTAAFASSVPSVATMTGATLKSIASGVTNVTASAAGVTSNPVYPITVGGTVPTQFTITGGSIIVSGSQIAFSGVGSSASTIVPPIAGNTYYISPAGSDTANGTSVATPWLTPNHPVNCGDTILAAAGTYNSNNFYNGQWGTVSCPAANNVAWLQCAVFDTCKISATSQQGMYVSSSYWGISGWEISDNWEFGNCFYIQPTGSTAVHHVIFANNVAIGCVGGGFVVFSNGAHPVDYISFIGNIAYGTSSGSQVCASGFSIGFIAQLDTNPGTHLFVDGNFAWNNNDPPSCAGTPATDGEGMIFDTLRLYNYTQQAAAENNIFAWNGGRGLEYNNNNNTITAPFFSKNNTTYGNNTQTGQDFPQGLGEIYINNAFNTNSTLDIAQTSADTIAGNAIYSFAVIGSNGTSTVNGDWFWAPGVNYIFSFSNPGFSFGTNTFSDPQFVSTTMPGTPACSGKLNVVDCAAPIINALTPQAAGASLYGYQKPKSVCVSDPLYPIWLKSVTLPTGLITPGC